MSEYGWKGRYNGATGSQKRVTPICAQTPLRAGLLLQGTSDGER